MQVLGNEESLYLYLILQNPSYDLIPQMCQFKRPLQKKPADSGVTTEEYTEWVSRITVTTS